MKGTFIQDTLMLINMILMIFLMVFWTVNFGVEKMDRLMESSPKYIQQHIAGMISSISTADGNVTTKLYTDAPEIIIVVSSDEVEVTSSEKKKYKKDVKRGGHIAYETEKMHSPFVIREGIEVKTGTFKFRSALGQKYVEVTKIGNRIGVGGG